MRRPACVIIVWASLLAGAPSAYGAPQGAAPPDEKSAAQEQFEEGQRAFAAGDFVRAAAAFEQAYRKKPHYSPLWNAGLSWDRAGDSVRAANLYARYLREAPADARDRPRATEALKKLAPRLGKIVVHGFATEVRIDGEPAGEDGTYARPGEHVVTGRANGELIRRTVEIAAEQELSVALEPSPGPPPPAPAPVEKPAPSPPPPRGFRLPPAVVYVGGALVLAGAGLTAWSGLDTLNDRDLYEQRFRAGTATQADLDDGRARQRRTNVLLAATGGVALLTLAAAFFVDWWVRPAATAGGAAVIVGGNLR